MLTFTWGRQIKRSSRPERNVDDITDMRRSCRLRENTFGRRPLGSSSRLFKVPNQTKAQNRTPILLRVVYSAGVLTNQRMDYTITLVVVLNWMPPEYSLFISFHLRNHCFFSCMGKSNQPWTPLIHSTGIFNIWLSQSTFFMFSLVSRFFIFSTFYCFRAP